MTEVSLEDFKKNDLRVAKILDVQELEGADRLWKLIIDTGQEKKQIVAGIKPFYTRESLLGKTIVILNNVSPAVIRGAESRGMLLAAKNGSSLTLLTLDQELPAGSLVG